MQETISNIAASNYNVSSDVVGVLDVKCEQARARAINSAAIADDAWAVVHDIKTNKLNINSNKNY